MKTIGKKLLAWGCALTLAVSGVTGTSAQERKNQYSVDANNVLVGGSLTENITITAPLSSAPPGGDAASILQVLSQEMTFDFRLVESAPFSATVVSATIQTLADGTRITQHSEGRTYRDSQGRTRNERSFRGNETGAAKHLITIHDPVVGVSYTLDPDSHSARKAPSFRKPSPVPAASSAPGPNVTTPRLENSSNELSPGAPTRKVQPHYPPLAKAARATGVVQLAVLVGEAGEILEAAVVSGHPLLRDASLEAAFGWRFRPTEFRGKPVKFRAVLNFKFALVNDESAPATASAPSGAAAGTSAKQTVNTEKLPKQMIEGVECEGERLVTTLLTGAIGNDRPIETVQETWRSPELRITILSRRSDPRFGESTYRLTNLSRAEPEAALFQVPPAYTIK